MSRKKSNDFYKAAVKALRPYADFKAKDGYDLREVLSPSQKRKITLYHNAVKELTARSNYVFRGRNAERVKIAKEVAQTPKHLPALRVAFVPYSPPVNKPDERPKLTFTKTDLIVETATHRRKFIPFNKKRLITDTDLELARAFKAGKKAGAFTIQVGPFEIATPMQDYGIARKVKELMAKYDGAKPLPASSGNRGDDPRHHHYSKWLNGLVSYEFKRGGPGNKPNRLADEIAAAKKARKTRAERARLAREYVATRKSLSTDR